MAGSDYSAKSGVTLLSHGAEQGDVKAKIALIRCYAGGLDDLGLYVSRRFASWE